MDKPATLDNGATEDSKATAVLIFHGMGQQVPFETLGNVAEKIRNRPEFKDAGAGSAVTIENVSCLGGAPADAVISRVRMRLKDKDGNPAKTVDFYESYWAPITAGKVTSLDALKFLVNAGRVGIFRSLRKNFTRYFWEGRYDFRLNRVNNVMALGGVLLLVVSLALIFTRTISAFSDNHWQARLEELSLLFRALHLLIFPTLIAYLIHTRKKTKWPVKAGLVLISLLALVQLPSLFMQDGFLPGTWIADNIPVKNAAMRFAILVILGCDLASIVLAALAINLSKKPEESRASYTGQIIWQQSWLIGITIAVAAFFALWLMINPELYKAGQLSSPMNKIIYGIIGLGVLFGMRYFLIEYVGDLAAYLSAQEASKFSEMRSRIQGEAFKTACHVYATPYKNVIVVGHSLGSVLAYDTLNGVISHDAIKAQGWQTVERTQLLLTFGSPLNKTAFIFRAQVENNPTREVLSAGKQPLLAETHRYRPRAWVNVWSPCDVISGRLEFYDRGTLKPADKVGGQAPYAFNYAPHPPSGPANPRCENLPFNPQPSPKTSPVISLIDPKADIPFAAHTQFWENTLIYDVLTKALQDDGSGTEFAKLISVKAVNAGGGNGAGGATPPGGLNGARGGGSNPGGPGGSNDPGNSAGTAAEAKGKPPEKGSKGRPEKKAAPKEREGAEKKSPAKDKTEAREKMGEKK